MHRNMIVTTTQHHETLTLLEQLLLTGSLIIPCAKCAVDSIKEKRRRKKNK